MLAYLVRRLLWGVALLVTISIFTFTIFFVLPVEPTQVGRGPGAVDISLRQAYELKESGVPAQYAQFVWRLVSGGSLGESFSSGRPVTDILEDAVPVTASLVVGGTLLFMLIAVPIGIVSALRPRSLLDRVAMVIVLIGISAHPAWIGLILSYFVGYRWDVTPIGGYCDMFDPATTCGGPRQWAYHLLLPWLTFAILFAALYARMIRANVIETLDEDYVRTARAKGAPRWLVLRSHVIRNAMLPVVTMLGMDVGLAFGGSVFIEQVYGLPGIGKTVINALARRDLPVIMGVVLVVTVAIIIFNLIVDLVYGWLDPRVRRTRSSADLDAAAEARSPAPKAVPAAPPASS